MVGVSKKIITGLLAIVISFSSSLTTANGIEVVKENTEGISGTGLVEGYVDQGVMRVVLPATDINYIIDPMGLIKMTNGAAYSNAEFDYTVNGVERDDGFVFFKRRNGMKASYSSSIDLTFQNKSSFPVKASVSATFASGSSNMILKEFGKYDGVNPGIGFMICDSNGNSKSITQVTETTFQKSMRSFKEAYSLSYYKSNYIYSIDDNKYDISDIPEYKVSLIGQCDPNSDWSKVDASKSILRITWHITKDMAEISGRPSIKNLAACVDSAKRNDVILSLDYNSNSSLNVVSVSYKLGEGREVLLDNSDYSVTNDLLVISADAFRKLSVGSYTYKVKFSNNMTDTVRIDIK